MEYTMEYTTTITTTTIATTTIMDTEDMDVTIDLVATITDTKNTTMILDAFDTVGLLF
jgi:hypothetical protein